MTILECLTATPRMPHYAGGAPRWCGFASGWPMALYDMPEFAELLRICGTVSIDSRSSSNYQRIMLAAKAYPGLLRVNVCHFPWREPDGETVIPLEKIDTRVDPQQARLETLAGVLRKAGLDLGYIPEVRVFCDLEHWKRDVWNSADTDVATRSIESVDTAAMGIPGVTAVDWYEAGHRRQTPDGYAASPYLPTKCTNASCVSLYHGGQIDTLRKEYENSKSTYHNEFNCCYAPGWGPVPTEHGYGKAGYRDYPRGSSWQFGRDLFNAGAWPKWSGERDFSKLRAFYLWPAPQPIGWTDPKTRQSCDPWWWHFSAICCGANDVYMVAPG